MIRTLASTYGFMNASKLVMVSGRSDQMVFNALSSNVIDLPPLPIKYLRRSCQDVLKHHMGEVYFRMHLIFLTLFTIL
jgi:hypothetical protein